MGQLVGFFLHPPLSEIAKKLGKMLKYGVYFNIFPNFWQFQKVGGVRKSRPIAPFLGPPFAAPPPGR